VKGVDLVVGEEIDVRLDVLHAEEVARDVEHRSAPCEAREIVNRAGCNVPGAGRRGRVLDGRRQELTDRLQATEHAGGLVGREPHLVGADREVVSLVSQRGIAGGRQDDVSGAALRGVRRHHGERVTGRRA